MEVVVPQGSIYLWMYEQGLRGVDINDIVQACALAGKSIREKDFQNYFNGFGKHQTIEHRSIFDIKPQKSKAFYELKYSEYPYHPFQDIPDTQEIYVPCDSNNKPMIKWGEGCMSKQEAESLDDQVYLAENMLGQHRIIIDCDGDHDEGKLDLDTIEFLWQFSRVTEVYKKPKYCIDYGCTITEFMDTPASFHLTFMVDRIIPTMHFPFAHIDIIGNKKNSLRYFKNKKCNNLPLVIMNDDIWDCLVSYIKWREENSGN